MLLPDFVLLKKIKVQHVYCDKSSQEKYTGVVKKKYKLAGNVIEPLKIYTFFVTTTNKIACQKLLTIEVEAKHWEQAATGYLNKPIGYIDISKIEPLSEQELLGKMKDRINGFPCIAKLCDEKYQELKELRKKVHMSRNPMPLERSALVSVALDDIVDINRLSQDVIDRLGLN